MTTVINSETSHGPLQSLKSARQYRALRAIAEKPQTVRDIVELAGCNNAPGLVATLQQKGLVFMRESITGLDRDGHSVRLVAYSLAPGLTEAANQLLRDYENKEGRG